MYGPVALARCSDRSRWECWRAAARDFIYHGCLKTLQLGVRRHHLVSGPQTSPGVPANGSDRIPGRPLTKPHELNLFDRN